MTPPRIRDKNEPSYTKEAREAHHQGIVLLWIVVDEAGKVTQVKVVRCVGGGLDEKAVDAVSRWRFDPARKAGKPVAVQLNVEVSFNLY